VAKSLGVNVGVVRGVSIVISVMLAAVIISFAGVIGFIGLVGPHVARLIIGADHRWLVPFSVISGGALLLVADTIGRLAFSPAVIPVGIVIAFVGVPIFLHLILARRNEYFS
jgi:iron complex transport system permease protein